MENQAWAMPNFCRLVWTSDFARETWQPRLERIKHAWAHAEWFSVKTGGRRAALTQINPRDYPGQCRSFMEHGLFGVPVACEAVQNSYSANGRTAAADEAFVYRMVVTQFDDGMAFKDAWDRADTPAIAELLGYPKCCADFFEENWIRLQSVDTTWAMAQADAGERCLHREAEVFNNILWRWMGVRFVPFLPCSFDCEATRRAGEMFRQTLLTLGYEREVDWMEEILRWPVEWNALHGIVEIRTPILKVIANTDVTNDKYVVRLAGSRYPAEGAAGLEFPWKDRNKKSSGENGNVVRKLERAYYLDNGFQTVDGMLEAHHRIVEAFCGQFTGAAPMKVLDLGCGNGALLQSLKQRLPQVVPYGVDLVERRIRNAGLLHPGHADNFWTEDLFAGEVSHFRGDYDYVFLMPGRLAEVDAERRAHLLRKIVSTKATIVAYLYDEWVRRWGNIRSLCPAVGLEMEEEITEDFAIVRVVDHSVPTVGEAQATYPSSLIEQAVH